MRTTVTLEKDVEQLLREAMHRSRRSFKETLNAAVRAGLAPSATARKGKPFKVKARAMQLRAGIDPASLNQLVDELEVEAFLESTSRRPRP